MKASIYTLGCRVNQYESDAICEKLKKSGFEIVPFGEQADISIVNTCTVTAESDRKSRQIIRRAKKISPNAKIIVTGCFAQAFPDAVKSIGADAVVGNGRKSVVAEIAKDLVTGKDNIVDVTDISKVLYDETPIEYPKRARTFIKIEDGCENRCAYCIIPKARGNVRSRNADEVMAEVERISQKGCKEIILTGIETASYGRDLGNISLADLIIKTAGVKGIERVTLGSLEPTCLNEDFLQKVSDIPELLPHFHLSIQSGCTETLNRMRRKYTAEMVLKNIDLARKYIPGVTFSSDVITGFPGETEEEFAKTLEFFKKADFLHLHIFPYSERKGTDAAEMSGKVPEGIRRERSAALLKMQEEIKYNYLDKYIKEHKENPVFVLVEKWENGVSNGHTEHFVECNIKTECDLTGKIIPVHLVGRVKDVLSGVL